MQSPIAKLFSFGSPRSDLRLVHLRKESSWSLANPLTQFGRLQIGLFPRFSLSNEDKLLKSIGNASSERLHPQRLNSTKEHGKEPKIHELLSSHNSFIRIPSVSSTFNESMFLSISIDNSLRFEQPDIINVSSDFSIQMFLGSILIFLQSFIFK
ncbi:hypothetical protein ACE6H2_007357 [Prunus campanulata]